jgi:hypothetical protein
MQRKIVTVVFCDVTGSTALGESIDPEALRGLLARYFERMKSIVERHGGTVEKFIGDAVMAVFGVPIAHEDDALRAVRAAAEMRDALPELDIRLVPASTPARWSPAPRSGWRRATPSTSPLGSSRQRSPERSCSARRAARRRPFRKRSGSVRYPLLTTSPSPTRRAWRFDWRNVT